MTPLDKNWYNLFGEYTTEGTSWHAKTTVYSLELDIIRAYQFTRKFSTNADQSIVYHHNTYYFDENNIKEQSWQLNKEECNQIDGVVHPEALNMRAISFDKNISIWVAKQFNPEKNFGSEAFFKQGDSRYGVITVYENCNLSKFVIIKENTQDFPESIDNTTIGNLSGKWRIKQVKFGTDLEEATEELITQNIELYLNIQGNQTYNLPEKIRFNVPPTISSNQEFTIIVGQQTSDTCYQQIASYYDNQGQLTQLVSSQFEKL